MLTVFCTSLNIACRGKLEFELGRKRCAYGPQNASYSSDRISARVVGVKTYFLEPGIVSRAKRSLERGSDVLSRPSSLDCSKDEKPDMALYQLQPCRREISIRICSAASCEGAVLVDEERASSGGARQSCRTRSHWLILEHCHSQAQVRSIRQP